MNEKADAKVVIPNSAPVGKPTAKGFVTAPAADLYQRPSWDGLSALSASLVSVEKSKPNG